MTSVLLGLANDLISEDDPDLAVGRFALNGFETGFFGSLGVHPLHVVLEFAHEEEDPHDRERPDDEYCEEESLVGGHSVKCRV
jgi:hypothetical protein